jgi:CspA family cold shock protein
MDDRETGTVKWFNNAKGFGFIDLQEHDDVFVHFRSIRGDGYRTLKQGVQVEFNLVTGEKGLQAEDVVQLTEIEEVR